MTSINPKNGRPLYKQVEDYILKNINDNIFKPGEAIPPERELSENLNVSRYTIRKAIQRLVHKGYLYRVQGSGTFVFEKNTFKGKDPKKIGVIITSYRGTSLNILQGIEQALEENNYKFSFVNSHNNYKKEAESIQQMKSDGVSGLVIYAAEDQKDSTAITDLKNEGFPFVLVDRRLQHCETNCVMSDNISGGFKATEYLIRLGHEKIGFIKNQFTVTSSIEDRIVGYQNALNQYGFKYSSELIFSYNQSLNRQEINRELHKFIKQNKLTAVIGVHDLVALDIVKMCRKNNIKIPEELSIIGFDSTDIVKHLEVPLTMINQFPKKMGFKAAKMLIDMIEANVKEKESESMIQQIYYPVELMIRNSCSEIVN